MLLNGIMWIIMQQSGSYSMFTLDPPLTVFNLIYKSLFYHERFGVLSIIINTIKLFAKKRI